MICPPAIDLATALHSVKGSEVMVGAQNMHFAEEGAFTGEISAAMLVALGVTPRDHRPLRAPPVLCRDRRHRQQKLITALKHRLVPIVCVGEQ